MKSMSNPMSDVLLSYRFLDELKNLLFVRKLVLYGSRARGTNRSRSDIDLAVDCEGASRNDWLKVVDVVENADTLLKIDCIRLDELLENNPLRQKISEEGVILYEKKQEVME